MPHYLLAYHGGSIPETEEAQAASLEAWNDWMEAVGDQLLDGGNPVGQSKMVTANGGVADTTEERVTGYSIVEADDLDAAIEIARGCPILADGGSVEVAELIDMTGFDDEDEDEDDEDD